MTLRILTEEEMRQIDLERTPLERLKRYLGTNGFFFCSNPEQIETAREACRLGITRPVNDLLPPEKQSYNSQHTYVRAETLELPDNVLHLLEEW